MQHPDSADFDLCRPVRLEERVCTALADVVALGHLSRVVEEQLVLVSQRVLALSPV